jgi:hypothetical protein
VANYPTYPQLLAGTSHEVLDDMSIDRATDGTGYGRSLFAAVKHRFVVRHVLSFTTAAALSQFYIDNKRTPFDFTWDGAGGASFTNVLFESAPKLTDLGNGAMVAESRLVTL